MDREPEQDEHRPVIPPAPIPTGPRAGESTPEPPPPDAADAVLWPLGPPPSAAPSPTTYPPPWAYPPPPPLYAPAPPTPPAAAPTPRSPSGRRAARPARRRWLVVVGIVVAGLAVALGIGTVVVLLGARETTLWIASADEALVGRVDIEGGRITGTVDVGSSSVEVVSQDGEAVVVYDTDASRVLVVDPSEQEITDAPVRVPVGSRVEAGGGVAAVLDTADGELWVTSVAELGELDVTSDAPALDGLSSGSRVAVGLDGVTYVVDPGQAALFTVDQEGELADADGVPLQRVSDGDDLLVTAVGDAPVVLDRTNGRLYLPGSVVDVHASRDARLQRPGPTADAVLLATSSALVSHPLDGGPAGVVGAGGQTPPAPVFVDGCGYAAWHGSGAVVRDCPGTEDDLVGRVDAGDDAELRFRFAGDAVVLNDQRSGAAWRAAGELGPIGEWPDGP